MQVVSPGGRDNRRYANTEGGDPFVTHLKILKAVDHSKRS